MLENEVDQDGFGASQYLTRSGLVHASNISLGLNKNSLVITNDRDIIQIDFFPMTRFVELANNLTVSWRPWPQLQALPGDIYMGHADREPRCFGQYFG